MIIHIQLGFNQIVFSTLNCTKQKIGQQIKPIEITNLDPSLSEIFHQFLHSEVTRAFSSHKPKRQHT